MGRHERRQFFESLVQMRDRYADRPSDDLPGEPLPIGDAMIYADAVMRALEAEEMDLDQAAADGAKASRPKTGAKTDGAKTDVANAAQAAPDGATVAEASSDEATAGTSAPPDA
jgi:hypothetical protein